MSLYKKKSYKTEFVLKIKRDQIFVCWRAWKLNSIKKIQKFNHESPSRQNLKIFEQRLKFIVEGNIYLFSKLQVLHYPMASAS